MDAHGKIEAKISVKWMLAEKLRLTAKLTAKWMLAMEKRGNEGTPGKKNAGKTAESKTNACA